jgi:hypothetical protein
VGTITHQWIDDRASLFGVEIALQFRRTLDVGEQGSDSLALTVECERIIGLLWREPNVGRV